MRFVLVDRIVELAPPVRIVAQKGLSLAEEYLADHFPRFPVMPGVLMLEGLVQTAAWLVRAAQDFDRPVIVLREARNVTYKSFVAPGQVLTLEAECRELRDGHSVFTASGRLENREIVKAHLTLRHLEAASESLNETLRSQQRAMFERLMERRTPATASA